MVNLHYLHGANLDFVIYLLTCTTPTFFRNTKVGSHVTLRIAIQHSTTMTAILDKPQPKFQQQDQQQDVA